MTDPPKFFVPAASTPEMAEEVLAAVRKFARTTMGEHISFGPRRIFRLRYRHNGQTLEAEVDKPEPLTGEPVIVILDANPYLICTPERGVVRGMPILVGAAAALEVTEFASD